MCKYKYENKGSNLDGTPCIFPNFYTNHHEKIAKDLPIDKDGYCIYHSNNDKWKQENDFKNLFFELVNIITQVYAKEEKHKWEYLFAGFIFPTYDLFKFDEVKLINAVDFSSCIFNCRIEFLNMNISSLDIQHSTFIKRLYFSSVDFTFSLYANNATFHNGLSFISCSLQKHLLFEHCTFSNRESESCDVSIKKCKSVHYLSFANSIIKPMVFIFKSSIDYELNFNHCTIENEFVFEECQVNGTLSFQEAEFTLAENVNPMMSGVHFSNIEINEKGKIIFKGKHTQDEMIRSELSIHFKEKPKGLISFENFNLNKIYPKFKASITELEKEGIVEIGKGCRKYYCQTEIFTMNASKATQMLILDLVKVFCNYFELQENYNLGIEIVERNKLLIRYFYFTDEEISYNEFLEKINHTEFDLWETFSNLSRYSINSVEDVEKRNLLIDIAGLFLKLGNYTKNNLTFSNDFPKILSSISAEAATHIDKANGLVINIQQGKSHVQTDDLKEVILNGINSFSNTTPKINFIMEVNQTFNGPIGNVINADNFFQDNKTITSQEKGLILEEAIEIKKEQSVEVKERKWQKFVKKWAGTISEVATPILKGLIMS